MTGKRPSAPQWFKDAHAKYRGLRAAGDLSASELREHLADDVQARHEAGDPFGRSVWVSFIAAYDAKVNKAQGDIAAEEWALAEATGLLRQNCSPRKCLRSSAFHHKSILGGRRRPRRRISTGTASKRPSAKWSAKRRAGRRASVSRRRRSSADRRSFPGTTPRRSARSSPTPKSTATAQAPSDRGAAPGHGGCHVQTARRRLVSPLLLAAFGGRLARPGAVRR